MSERDGRWRRELAVVISSAAVVSAWPAAVMAGTGTPPDEVPSQVSGFEPWWLLPIGLGVGLFLTVVSGVVVAVLRPAARRPIAALGVFVAAALAAAFFVLVALFTDWSGNHRIAWPALAVAGGLIVAGAIAAMRISRARRPR